MGLSFKSFVMWTRTQQEAEDDTGMTTHNLRLVLEYVVCLFASLGCACLITNISQRGLPFGGNKAARKVDDVHKSWLQVDCNKTYVDYCEQYLISAPSDKHGHYMYWCGACWSSKQVPMQVWGRSKQRFPPKVRFQSSANVI